MNRQIVGLLKTAKENMDRGEYAEALTAFTSALACEPGDEVNGEIYFHSGICHFRLEEYAAAEECLETALDILKDRDYNDVKHIYEVLRLVYKKILDFDKLTEICLRTQEYDDKAVIDLMYAYVKAEKWNEQLAVLEKREITAENLIFKMQCFKNTGRIKEGISAAREYISLFGEDKDVCENLMEFYYNAREPEKGFEYFKKAIEKSDSPEWRFKVSSILLGKDIYHHAADGEDFFRVVRSMRLDGEALEQRRDFNNALKPFKRLRLGYLSADLREHPGGYFLLPVMLSTVNSHCFIKCYSLMSPKLSGSRVMRQIQNCADEWADVYEWDNSDIEEMFLADGIDIAFDLMGHTAGNRIEVFARRVAPVQISWLCFPVTAGTGAMDYILTDRITDPPGECEKYYAEKPLYMPETYLCYTLSGEPRIGPPAFERNGYITFACFHNVMKVTDKTLRMWRRILEQVENSVLKVVGNIPPGEENFDRVVRQFRRNGLPMERVSISRSYGFNEYYDAYNGVDIMLDTYPFSGATTTFDAFKMGTPIISLAGERHVSRVGYGMLKNVGLEDLAAFTEDEYVEKAVGLAKEPERLRRICRELPERTENSVLVDQPRFRMYFEKTIRDAWVAHCLEKRKGRWDYSGDGLRELLEQAMNATVYFERKLDLEEDIDDTLREEYHLLQSALLAKLKSLTDDREFINDYERFVSFTGRRLGGAELRAVLGLAKRYIAVL